jgi:HPt (histidine-containing phosphotransfer) domain-containing protein
MLNPSSLNSRLADLRRNYRARIAAEASALRRMGDQQDVAGLREICHRLVGTAGSYGFGAVADAAENLGAGIDGKCDIPAVLLTALCQAIEDLAVSE